MDGHSGSQRYKILDSYYDKVLLTVPTPIADKILSRLTTDDPQLTTDNLQLTTHNTNPPSSCPDAYSGNEGTDFGTYILA